MDPFKSAEHLSGACATGPHSRGAANRLAPSRHGRGRLRAIGGLSLTALLVAGCAQKGQLLGGGSSNGMKTTLSHLQFENEQLKTEMAKLKEENRSMEDRLVQEQLHSGDLAARLDNARNLLRDRGTDSETRVGSRTRSELTDTDDELARPRTLPAGRTSRKPRKPPAAAIPGELDANLPSAPDDESDESGTISFRTPGSASSRPQLSENPGQAPGDRDDAFVWQPVAQGDSSPASPARR
ncbi:MAG: cell division protein ZapB [Isosphaeraceae bacterium]